MMRTWASSYPADHGNRLANAVRGFSLIEIAVVLFIIALLLGSFLVPLVTQVEQRQISETEKTLAEIRDALLGFAVANGYLPCPDKVAAGGAGVAVPPNVANDGIEDVNTLGACSAASDGNVPWVTLGVGASDVWGNRFRYQVTPAFSQRPGTFSLASIGNIRVCTASACAAQQTADAVVVIISLGKNGLGAISATTGAANPAPVSADENANLTGPTTFVSRTMSPIDSPAGEFDDIVTWLSKHTLFNRMVAAGKLP